MTDGPAGQLLTVSWMSYTETRQYNNLLQMTRLTAAGGSQGSLDLEYKFSSNQSNGRITAMKDWVTGEEVQYTYDALQRLTRAETIGPEWGSTYGYDGFGNLLQKNAVKGSGVPLLNIAVDPWTNRVSGLSGGSYDANGNDLTAGAFDIANRLKQSGSTYFQYDAANKRVWKGTVAGGAITSEEFYFYAPWGAKLAAYRPTNYLNMATMTIVSSNEYFGGKLIKINGTAVLTDRLGSNVSNGKRYFPYGEERGSTANNIEKFGTYFRDAETGLDYADQRYYKGSWGRFGSADPALGGKEAPDQGSWNQYSYAQNDPANFADPSGNGWCDVQYGSLLCTLQYGFVSNPSAADIAVFNPADCFITRGGLGFLAQGSLGACAGFFISYEPQRGAEIPLLECKLENAKFGTAESGIADGRPGYNIPVTFTFSVTGGQNGRITWSNRQVFTINGSVTYTLAGEVIVDNQRGREMLRMEPNGSRMTLFDYPGLAADGRSLGLVLAATLEWSFHLIVTVQKGSLSAVCEIDWRANLSWKTVGGKPSVTGSAGLKP